MTTIPVGGSLEAGTTLIPKNNIKASFHYKRDSHSDRNRVYTLGSGNSAKTVYPPWAQDDNATISAGLEDTIDFTKNFYSIAGISYDRMEGLRANKWVYNGTNTTPIKHNFDTTTSNSWNPQIGFFYLISDTGKLHASIEKKTRFPTMKEKYSWGLPSSGKQTIENPNLKPEESINYEVGYEDLFFKDLRFKVALFHNNISDAIESVTFREGGTQYTQNQNISKVKQYGIETGVTYSFFDFLETGFNYTYLDRRNKARDLTVGGYKLTSVPVHKFFSYARYATPLKGLSVQGSLEYNTKRYSTTDGASASIARAFSVVNTKAMYKMNKVDGLTVEAGINNLFDRNYELVAGYPEPGRTYFMGMRYNF